VVPSDDCIGSSCAFSGNIQRGIRAEMSSTGWTDAIIGSSDAQKMLKCSGFFQSLVENFISFPTSTRSPKTEFGAESYGKNTEGQRRGWQDEPLVLSVQLQYSDAQKLVKYSGFFLESCVEFHNLSNEYKLVENGVRSKEIRAKYGRSYGSTRWSDAA
jgi:hypothetical protein